MDIRKILLNTSEKYAIKTGIVFEGREISFHEIREQVIKLANGLSGCGVSKGDKVAIYLPNSPEYIYSYLACFHLGAVGVPLDFMLKDDELISCLGHSESKVLIARDRPDIDLGTVRSSVASLDTVILCSGILDGAHHYQDLVNQAPSEFPQVNISDSDPALIMYTSGTTGKPKGVLLNYKHLEGSPSAMEHFVDLSDQDIKLAAIPLSHIAGLIYIQNMLMFGITLVLMERFNPYKFLELIHQYKITCFHIVPAMYHAILSLKQIEKFDLSSLRWVVVFGAPSSPEKLERFHKYCPNAKLLNGWGMTETCPPNTVTPLDSDNIASVGKPAPSCKIIIVDEQDNELAIGEIGEIVISGWVIMDCYYKDPDETTAVKRNGGLYTGDLGRFDKEGFLYIVGRKKEMIKVAGQIVYAPEVESAFYKNENVAEVAVIGVPDEMRGESIKAYIVLNEGVIISSEELRYFAKDHLANFKVPHTIEIRKELPKNRTGKIDKNLLKEEQIGTPDTSAPASQR